VACEPEGGGLAGVPVVEVIRRTSPVNIVSAANPEWTRVSTGSTQQPEESYISGWWKNKMMLIDTSIIHMPIPISLFLLMLPDLTTVPKVDLQKYSGAWYEIARLPNRFQKDCASDVMAEYTLKQDGKIKVVNRCRGDGKSKLKEAEGVARVAESDNGSNSILEVRFAPAILSFLDRVWGDYRIIALDDEYRYAMVASNDRKYLWILSRTKTLDDAVYRRLVAAAVEQGFSVDQMIRTRQN